ncbi:hypothetical protein [Liquorilactobacillus ghanensis]|uniref:hypothetical protein n=1 Tax=Liquorilactobacillus ghanensis TaxID=399370 RepID=UPI0039E7495E
MSIEFLDAAWNEHIARQSEDRKTLKRIRPFDLRQPVSYYKIIKGILFNYYGQNEFIQRGRLTC